jgi:hypothetical protein
MAKRTAISFCRRLPRARSMLAGLSATTSGSTVAIASAKAITVANGSELLGDSESPILGTGRISINWRRFSAG